MRKVVCFILALVCMLSLACPAFATDSIPNQAPSIADNPKTGDIIMTWIVVMVLALIALVAIVIIYRKKFSR